MLAAEWAAICQTFGTGVRDLRHQLGWSQQLLAERSVLSQGTISRIESGNVHDLPFKSVVLACRTLAAGARTLGVPVSAATQALLVFCDFAAANFSVVEPLDPGLTRLVTIYHRLPRAARPLLMEFLEVMADWIHPTHRRKEGEHAV